MLDLFLQSDLASLPPQARAWRDLDAIRADRDAWLRSQLGRCSSAEFARRFEAACPVPGAERSDYLQHITTLDDGQPFLAGIRFRGSDLRFPFVDLVATGWGPGRLDEVWEVVAREWHMFAPLGIRVVQAEAPRSDHLDVRVDQWVYAAPLDALARRAPPAGADRLRLAACTTDDALDLVRSGYGTLPAHLRSIVQPATRSELEACAQNGRVRAAIVDGRVAGLIAAEPHAEFGLDGFVVIEELLTEPFRGQGLARALQRGLIDELAQIDPRAVLFGTIDGRNGPSMATARGVGRERVAAYWFALAR